MQTAINLITAPWRLFQSSKNRAKQWVPHLSYSCLLVPSPESSNDRFRVPKKPSGKTQHWPFRSNTPTDRLVHEEPVFTANSTRSSFVNISTLTANRADGDNLVPQDVPPDTSRLPRQQDTSRPSDNARESRNLSLQSPYTNDLLSLLTMRRDANQRI